MLLNHLLINKYIKSLDGDYSDDERDAIAYAAEGILGECEKLFIMAVIFALLHQFIPFVCVFAVFAVFRTNCGGIHMKTFLGCLSYSATLFAGIIYLSPYLSNRVFLLWYMILAITIGIKAPIISDNHLTPDRGTFIRRKVVGVVVTLTLLVLDLCIDSKLMMCARGTVIAYAIELLYIVIRRRSS